MNVTRKTLHRRRPKLFGQRLLEETGGEGKIFRAFNCELPPVYKDGVILDMAARRTPYICPDITVFREGECDVEKLVLQLAAEKRSFVLFGPPGTGKSYLIQRVLEILHDPVAPAPYVCARTHVAASQFDTGITLSRFKHTIQKGFFKGTLILDELFMVENSLLDVVAKVALNNDFMIFAGDDAQLPPIENT